MEKIEYTSKSILVVAVELLLLFIYAMVPHKNGISRKENKRETERERGTEQQLMNLMKNHCMNVLFSQCMNVYILCHYWNIKMIYHLNILCSKHIGTCFLNIEQPFMLVQANEQCVLYILYSL